MAIRLTQEGLAERAGMSPRGIAYLESGTRSPHRGTVSRLADALRLDDAHREALEIAAQQTNSGYTDEPSQLALPVANIVGREREVDAVVSMLLKHEIRLVTLTGVGGVGKTRLAVAVQQRLARELRDGVVSVPLETIRDPGLVVYAIARSLGLREAPTRVLVRSIEEHLRGREVLLLLDNFEQVLQSAWLVIELLGTLPGLKALVTSRAPLRVSGEHVFTVPPLQVPDPAARTQQAIEGSTAVELFMSRARAVRQDLRLDDSNADSVGNVARRLAGLPLAIELAAAQLRVVSISQLDARLAQGLPTAVSPRAADRHMTIEATLDWSFSLLLAPEQSLFRRLAAFVGGWTLEAVEAVDDQADVIDNLAGLIGQSLVIAEEHQGAMRYRMLEPVREYALRRLLASPDADSASARHADYYLALAAQAESELAGVKQAAWLDRLERELPNLRAALRWYRGSADSSRKGLRLARVLWRFWWLRGYTLEGREHLSAFLELAGTEVAASERARALHTLGHLAFRQGDTGEAGERFDTALKVAEEAKDLPNVAAALTGLGRLALEERRYAAAQSLFERSLQLGASPPAGESPSLTHTYLGWAAMLADDPTRAEEVLGEGLTLSHRAEDRDGEARILYSLGQLALQRIDLEVASPLFFEALKIDVELGYKHGVAMVLEGIADIAEMTNEFGRALRLGGAADALRKAAGTVAPGAFGHRHEERMVAARSALGTDEASAYWRAGEEMSMLDAVAEALNATIVGNAALNTQPLSGSPDVPSSGSHAQVPTRQEGSRRKATGGTQSGRRTQAADRFVTTILVIDVVGSTSTVSQIGDAAWRRLLDQHYKKVRVQLRKHNGAEIDTAGDGMLATFDGPASAISCARAIQQEDRSIGLSSRAGIHSGEVERAGSGIRGIAVHIAARLATLGHADEVIVSSTARDLAAGSGIRFESRGRKRLKGVPDARTVFAATD